MGPDLVSKPFDTLIVLQIFFLLKLILKKKLTDANKSMQFYPACKELPVMIMDCIIVFINGG